MKVQSLIWASLAFLALSACGAQAKDLHDKEVNIPVPSPKEEADLEKNPTGELTGIHAARYQQVELIEAELSFLQDMHQKLLDQPKLAEAFAAGESFVSESKSLIQTMQEQDPESVEAKITQTRLVGKSGAFLAHLATLVKLLPRDKATQEHLQVLISAVETLRSL